MSCSAKNDVLEGGLLVVVEAKRRIAVLFESVAEFVDVVEAVERIRSDDAFEIVHNRRRNHDLPAGVHPGRVRRAEKPGPGGSRHVFRKGFLVGVVEFVAVFAERLDEAEDLVAELGDRRIRLRGLSQRVHDRIPHDVRQSADFLVHEQLLAYLLPVRQLVGGKLALKSGHVAGEIVHGLAQLVEGVVGKIRGLAQLLRIVEDVPELEREVLGDLGELGCHRLSWEVLGEGLVPRVVVGDLTADVEVLEERGSVLHVERARVHRAVCGGSLRDNLIKGILKRYSQPL